MVGRSDYLECRLFFADPREGVVEDIVGDVAALGDPLGFVERPVDTEINPALAVFFFRLREIGEAARHVGTHITGVVFGHAVEFVGDKSERDVVGAKKSPHSLEKRAAKSGVPGRISREGWREIGTREIARGRAHWRASWIADWRCVAVPEASRAGAEIGFAKAAARAPQIIVIF